MHNVWEVLEEKNGKNQIIAGNKYLLCNSRSFSFLLVYIHILNNYLLHLLT
jgi:hypothetical protein